MATEKNSDQLVITYLNKYKIATIGEMKTTLNTQSRMTVFRRLSKLGYISSCSHSGKYYSLSRIAKYNQYGLWGIKSVLFSKYGTLKNTVDVLVSQSHTGYTASELNKILKIKVDDVLLELTKNKTINRKKIFGVYVYLSSGSICAKKQELTRKDCRRMPAISVDTKKKEPIGNFKNPGTRYKREADLANDHDFLTYAAGIAALYGVYDQQKNNGFVSIGMFIKEGKTILSGDTPEFAVESIERWWKNDGFETYRNQNNLLIVADAGGSNGHRPHMWKVKLQEILCNKYKFNVTVCHYPPGASKWNAIEHRLFSEISKNWRGTPLISYETVLKYTKRTKTKTGLKVNAILVEKQYEKGIKASKDDLEKLNIERHEVNPSWNYTLYPN
jgi:hypothetical protein